MVTALITFAALAWICQMAFGGWQIHQFNRAFDALCQKGRVGVGAFRRTLQTAGCRRCCAG